MEDRKQEGAGNLRSGAERTTRRGSCINGAVFHGVENGVDNGGFGGDCAERAATCENRPAVKCDRSTRYPDAVHRPATVDKVWMGESPICG